MKRDRAELKAEMQAKAEQAIDELLEWAEGADAPTLTEIEDKLLKLRKHMTEAMAQTLIAAQESVKPMNRPVCPECQRPMHYKAHKRSAVESRVGRLQLKRGHYYCEHCAGSLFPPG